MKIVQGDIETRRRSWSLQDDDGVALIPTSVTFVVRGVSGDVNFTVSGTGDDIAGVANNGDGTGTWTISAGDLAVGIYDWWAVAAVDGEIIIPQYLSGKLEIRDR